MKFLRKKRTLKRIALFLAFDLMLEILFPVATYALTAGPDSPEFSSFEPVATTDMVNLFTGDFNYNLPVIEIPGPDGGGYAMSLSYHSGNSSEQEASWVGFGWTLNPGAINRQMRGFPDDYQNVNVHKYNKMRPNWSSSFTNSLGMEFFSRKDGERKKLSEIEKPFHLGETAGSSLLNLGTSSSIRFNNYQGFSRYKGYDLGVKGIASLSFQESAQGVTFSAKINPFAIYNEFKEKATQTVEETSKNDKKINIRFASDQLSKGYLKKSALQGGVGSLTGSFTSTYGINSFSEASSPISFPETQRGETINWSTGLMATFSNLNIGFNTAARGAITLERNEDVITDYRANGYMHATNSIANRTLNDYYIEKNFPYQKRNVFLGIPFNNADNFVLSGEGLGGSFQFYPFQAGHFYPNRVNNRMRIRQFGFELNLGANVGIGADFGIGQSRSIIDDWTTNSSSPNAYEFPDGPATPGEAFTHRKGVFRFKGDMGGVVSYGNSELESASINWGRARLGSGLGDGKLEKDKYGASSHIAYHNIGECNDGNIQLFNGNLNLADLNLKNLNAQSIAEVSVHNNDGIHYVYGQPVFSQNEANLQFDVRQGSDIENHYLAYEQTALNSNYAVDVAQHNTVIGNVNPVPYANNYLITQILSYDYLDVNPNDGGPNKDDFGGWTQFHYFKKYGDLNDEGNNNWYHWRNPYNGLLYNKNQISDTKDDIGGVMTGEKEVYYLKAVETKTHIAFFVTNRTDPARFDENEWSALVNNVDARHLTGSDVDREDGLGAQALSNNDPASNSRNSKGNDQLEFLERIVLFHKDRPEEPLKTVRFQYDYHLVRNLPNSIDGVYPNPRVSEETGKLTLRRVWFEYEGISNARISPYEFTYKYKDLTTIANNIQAKYGNILTANSIYDDQAQNPDYQPDALDPWGQIQFDGRRRKDNLIPWVSQKPLTPEEERSFDPAAWQLKQITLPSGGEILIEYEQKDYAYVQNRHPMAMTSLDDIELDNVSQSFGIETRSSYIVNVEDLGIDPTDDASIDAQIALLQSYFQDEKMYFKFLYKLVGDGFPTLDDCQSEYITGYTEVDYTNIVKVPKPNATTGHSIRIPIIGKDRGDQYTPTPRQACYDFYTTQRLGKQFTDECLSLIEMEFEDDAEDGTLTQVGGGDIVPLINRTRDALHNPFYAIPQKDDVGQTINPSLSFLKLPMIRSKRGGGVRVKRLLMYDAGVQSENGDAVLYGQEYHYETFRNGQVISSGVATNEPSAAREENPLVTFIPRKGQSSFSRITSGQDREQSEGPLGESTLPAASIGHSRVVVENIHKGASGTGFTIQEYNTVKDYPFDGPYRLSNPNTGYYSDLEAQNGRSYTRGVEKTILGGDRQRQFSFSIPAGFFFFSQSEMWATQGFRFLQNQMHGQMKRVASFAGDYQPGVYIERRKGRITEQKYNYYEPGEQVKLLQNNGTWDYGLPGKEMQVAMEARTVRQKAMDISIDVDLGIGWAAPLVIDISASAAFELKNEALHTHATSKVISYPAIVKEITAFQDGVTNVTKNLAFNSHTGQTILTETSDGFDQVAIDNGVSPHSGKIYSLNLPASWYYPEMGRKSDWVATDNTSLHRTNQLSASVGSVVMYGQNPIYENGTDKFWPNQNQNWTGIDVIGTGIQTFKKGWHADGTPYRDQLLTEYGDGSEPTGLNEIYRPDAAYIYREDALSANTVANGIRQGGIIENFNFPSDTDWSDGITGLDLNTWILQNQIIQYSPNGNPIEEENALGVPSSAKFGYHQTVPTMVAANARYQAIHFEDYENKPINDPGFSSVAHSGQQSCIFVAADETTPIISNLISDDILVPDPLTARGHFQGGARIAMWVRQESNETLQGVNPELNINIGGAITPMSIIARSGEWILYRADIPATSFPVVGNTFDVFLDLTNDTDRILIDDVKFQPLDAQATCYVYEVSTLRLLAQFDDQHFGLFYQYDEEGKLTRKLIETERGLKTVTETQYNTPKQNRNDQ